MRSTLTTILVVALLAAGAGTAAARPTVSPARSEAAQHANAMRALGVHYQQLRTAEFDAGHASTATAAAEAPRPIVRVVKAPLADGGFDWADAGIGAGFALVLLLTAAGVAAFRRQATMTAH
jgi:hypothetical protein